MIPRSSRRRWSITILIGILPLLGAHAQAKSLSLGAISSSPSQEIKNLQPLAQYLEKEMALDDFDRVTIIIAKNIPQMAAFLKQKKVDLLLDDPYSVLAVGCLASTHPLLQAGMEGIEKHFSVIFVRKDSKISRFKDLTGETVAFDESFSTFGYWLPKMLLTAKGYKLKPLKTLSEKVGPDHIGYFFSQDDENTLLWVKKGKVKAGAVDRLHFEQEEKKAPSELKVVDRTLSLPPRILSIRSNLPFSVTDRVVNILKKMDRTEEGKKVLEEFNGAIRFQGLDQSAWDKWVREANRIGMDPCLKSP